MLDSCKEVEDDSRVVASLGLLLGVLDLRLRRLLVRRRLLGSPWHDGLIVGGSTEETDW